MGARLMKAKKRDKRRRHEKARKAASVAAANVQPRSQPRQGGSAQPVGR
jgi:hypothetical protein